MIQFVGFVDWLLALYMWIIIASAILSWLVAFNVVNQSNNLVYMFGSTLHRLTEPVVGRIRRFVPPMGGLDLSPLIALIAIVFLRQVVLVNLVQSLRFGG